MIEYIFLIIFAVYIIIAQTLLFIKSTELNELRATLKCYKELNDRYVFLNYKTDKE